MGLFQTIERVDDIPAVGQSFETSCFDVKMKVDARDHAELAKDVAAFANASGGVILVGVAQNDGKRIPMSAGEATSVTEAYSQAVKQRCRPCPTIDPRVLDVGSEQDGDPDKRFVVAVNVWPFPGQVVGVTCEVKTRKGGASDLGEAFKFPIRVGTHTDYLTPEVLPMLLSPDVRRMAILLDQIPQSERAGVKVIARFHFRGTNGRVLFVRSREIELKSVDAMRNSVVGEMKESDPRGLVIPLDSVEKVWHSGKVWKVLVRGQFSLRDGVWEYEPDTAAPR
jgi:Putative DNA-binding domain